MKGSGKILLPVLLAMTPMMSALTSCNKQETTLGIPSDTLTSDTTIGDSTLTTASRPEGWTFASHDKDAPADYATVFPENVVNRMEVTMSDSAWKAMNDDLSSMAGTFGSTGGFGGNGGMPGGGSGGMPGTGDTTSGSKDVGGMPGGQMPQEFYDAAAGKNPGDSCSCTMMGMTLSGIVDTTGGRAFCKPEMGSPGQIGGKGGGGGGMGAMGNTEFLPREPVYVPVTVEFNGKKWTRVGFRFKGNSSLMSAWGQGTYKLPFRMKMDEFEDSYLEIKNQRMYGFKDLSFANNYMDNSMIHEKMAADLLRGFGVPAAKSTFIRLYIDYGEGKKYFGLYTLVEVPDDKPFLFSWFGNADGNCYKPDGVGAYFSVFVDSSFVEKNNGKKKCKDVKAVFEALHADRSSAEIWRTNLESVFDVPIFLKWLAANTVINNWDAYGSMPHNYYLYNTNDRLTWIAWDLGLSFGDQSGMFGGQPGGQTVPGGSIPDNSTMENTGDGSETSAMPAFGGMTGSSNVASIMHDQTDSTWPLIRFLLDDPVYRTTYREYLRSFITTDFTAAALAGKRQTLHDLIAPYVTGIDAEQSGYSTLTSSVDFETAHTSLGLFLAQRGATVDSVLTVSK